MRSVNFPDLARAGAYLRRLQKGNLIANLLTATERH
jgi:hypothetical protein